MMGFLDKCNDFIVKRAVKTTANKLKDLDVRTYIDTPELLAKNLYVEFAGRRRERFFAYHVDIEGKIIERQMVSIGTIDSASAYIREIARKAILNDAAGVILAHTHIAYDHDPSQGDIDVTEKIIEAMQLLDLYVYDHIIVSKAGYYSFREEGNLFEENE